MKRNVIAEIERWDESGGFRKPLILMGARPVWTNVHGPR